MLNELKAEFPSLSENEALARLLVSGFISQLNPMVDELSDVKTAVSEAVTNCIVHAYRNTVGKVRMLVRIYDGSEVYIRITDTGCGIENLDKAMEPLFTSSPDEDRAGLGFTVMESFMDTLSVRSALGKGTTVTMRKKLRSRVQKDYNAG
ncbi:MAG: anti-sigma F factor [Oscillospiraceae bacterium]|nr:anti-sigma F factor [Oscillospiraceae bacterium]